MNKCTTFWVFRGWRNLYNGSSDIKEETDGESLIFPSWIGVTLR